VGGEQSSIAWAVPTPKPVATTPLVIKAAVAKPTNSRFIVLPFAEPACGRLLRNLRLTSWRILVAQFNPAETASL